MRSVRRSESAPVPLSVLVETGRLEAARQYRSLSALDRDGLSRLAREAAAGLDGTHASVSFVDRTRVWFGGAFGFDVEDMPRAGSLCDAVVRGGTALLVPDARLDPRFWDHAMVRGAPGLRSYAGVMLTDGGGYAIGTVAVYSMHPLRFTTGVLPNLEGVATLVREFLHEACPSAPEVIDGGVQGWFGVRVLAAKAGVAATAGLVIVSVKRGSPAAEAGLRATDIMFSIGGRTVHDVPDIAAALAGQKLGSLVRVRFRRGLAWHEADVEIRARRRRLTAG